MQVVASAQTTVTVRSPGPGPNSQRTISTLPTPLAPPPGGGGRYTATAISSPAHPRRPTTIPAPAASTRETLRRDAATILPGSPRNAQPLDSTGASTWNDAEIVVASSGSPVAGSQSGAPAVTTTTEAGHPLSPSCSQASSVAPGATPRSLGVTDTGTSRSRPRTYDQRRAPFGKRQQKNSHSVIFPGLGPGPHPVGTRRRSVAQLDKHDAWRDRSNGPVHLYGQCQCLRGGQPTDLGVGRPRVHGTRDLRRSKPGQPQSAVEHRDRFVRTQQHPVVTA